jgi:hypothetical protein
MTFEHEFFPRLYLEAFDTPEGRYYDTPFGDLPSVTTVLGKTGDKSGLDSWRTYIDGRDGPGTADGIVTQSKNRGDAVHKLAENYLNNKEDWKKGSMPVNLASFLKIRGVLDANIKKIYGLEFPLYSRVLRAAGSADILADWNGYSSVLDLKTSRKPIAHNGQKLLKWQLQTTAYAIMVEERFQKPFEQSVILTMVDNEAPQFFIFNNQEFRPQVKKIFGVE